MSRESLIRRYRKVSWGRLLWKSKRSANKRFESDDICIVKNGVLTTHYKNMEAFIRDIEAAEAEQS